MHCTQKEGFATLMPHLYALHLAGPSKPWLFNNNYVSNFSTDFYPCRFYWHYYLDIVNYNIRLLKDKGFTNLKEID